MPKALVPVNVLSLGTEPVGKYAGDLYFNSSEKVLYVYDGTTWNSVVLPTELTAIDGGQP